MNSTDRICTAEETAELKAAYMNDGRAPKLAEKPEEFGVMLADDNSMAREIPADSVVFLGAKGESHGDGIYCFGPGGPCNIYRVSFRPDNGEARLFQDNSPVEFVLTRAEFRRTDFWPVVGVARAYTNEFATFLRGRFRRETD